MVEDAYKYNCQEVLRQQIISKLKYVDHASLDQNPQTWKMVNAQMTFPIPGSLLLPKLNMSLFFWVVVYTLLLSKQFQNLIELRVLVIKQGQETAHTLITIIVVEVKSNETHS